jgi:hypothetical protein
MKLFIKITICICSCFLITNLYAQKTSFEEWQKKRQAEFEKFKKSRSVSNYPSVSSQQDSISSFINAGFENIGQQQNIQNQIQPVNSGTNIQQQPIIKPNIKIWAVVVGVASYNHISSLNYTDDDAYKVYAFFKSPEGGALPDEQISILIDEDATRQNIVNTLIDTYSNATEDDVIIFFFSGHGDDGAFISHEYDGTIEDENGNYKGFLLHKELVDVFNNCPARFKYIIADACHSGSLVNKGAKSLATDAMDNYYQAFNQSTGGLVIMLSSMGDEVSTETAGLRQGIFSYNLIQGMKGNADYNKDKIVSVVELFDYVQKNVKEYTNNRQNPVISGDYDVNMPITVVR